MKLSRKNRRTIGFFLFFLITIIIVVILSDNYWTGLYSNYPVLTKQMNIKKKVKKIRQSHGALLVEFMDNSKFNLRSPFNETDRSKSLYYFIEIGDSVLKKENSDTLILKRNSESFVYVISETKHVNE